MTTTPTIGILTPTIGKPELLDCLLSVANQTMPVKHYVVIDGHEYDDSVTRILVSLPVNKVSHIRLITLEENVGKGFYGHRVYSAVPALMNVDAVIYLDEDNTIHPNHCESLLKTMQRTQSQWVYSLRNIIDAQGNWLCRDNCESLGKWEAYCPDPRQSYYHIDTSCYCVPRALAIAAGPAWYGQWGADRVFFDHLKRLAPKFECSGEYTVNYRLGGNAGSVQPPYFLTGNSAYAQKYNNQFPWLKEDDSHAQQ